MQKTVLDSIKTSKNYRDICNKTIEKLIEQETPKYKKNKDIEQSVRTKLHLWAKMFFSDFNKSKKTLIDGENLDRDFYLQVLKRHCSTAERYDFLEEFFDDILSVLGDVNGDGTGETEYAIKGEFSENDFKENELSFERGTDEAG